MNDFDSIIKRITVTRLEPGDYTGEDGLLYCGKCRTPKQFRMEAPPSPSGGGRFERQGLY